MRYLTPGTIVMFLAAFAASACGGGSSSTPSTPSPTTTASVTIAITAINGNKSFAPNPVQAGGLPVVFSNNDSTVHHIVMDDGSADFGTINPGASSSAKTIGAGGNYHCELHPSMVGSINGAVAPDPAPGSGNGY